MYVLWLFLKFPKIMNIISEFPHKFSKRLESSIDATEMEDIILQVTNFTYSLFICVQATLISISRPSQILFGVASEPHSF